MPSAEHQRSHEYAEPHTYVERLGVGVDKLLEQLAEAPKRELVPAEREAFFAIDQGLLEGRYDRDLGEGIDGAGHEVEGWYKEPTPPVNFVLDYFATDAGRDDLAAFEEAHGIEPDVIADHPSVQSAQRLAALGRLAEGDKGVEAQLKKLASRSHNHTVDRIEHALANGEDLEDSEHVYIFPNPQKTIDQVQQVQQMRGFLRQVRSDLLHHRPDLTDNVRDALLTSVDGLRQKATAQLGTLYPNVISLYHQALLMRDTDPSYAQALGAQLVEVSAPMHTVLTKAQEDSSGDIEDRFTFTMDRWRNGVAPGAEDGEFSKELQVLEERLDNRTDGTTEQLEAVFTPEEIAYLDSLEFNAEDMADMVRYWLRRNNILSDATDEMFEKGNWPLDSAADHPRIGVAVGEFANLAYDRGWIMIPKSTKRRLRQATPSGPALVIPHEEQHAIDGLTAEYGEQQVSATKVSARNSMGVREGVGKQEENAASQHLFGQSLRQSTVFAKALQVWGETGSESAAVVAYARQAAREQGLPDITRKLLETAQNRVQRLVKSGIHAAGGWNSQPLVYIEQVLVADALQDVPPSVRDTVAANSYLDLPTMARFHEFGLLATDRYQPEATPIQAMEEYLRELLAKRSNT